MWSDTTRRILLTIRALFVLFLVFPLVLCDAPVTIDQNDAYSNQRVCAFKCFQDFDDVGYPIAQEISCPTFKVMNDCFCRKDLQQEAHLFISSCINFRCSKNALDISTATSLYDNYCTNNGYTETLVTTSAQESGAFTVYITEKATLAEATATVTETVVSTVTRSAAQSLVYSFNMVFLVAASGITTFLAWATI